MGDLLFTYLLMNQVIFLNFSCLSIILYASLPPPSHSYRVCGITKKDYIHGILSGRLSHNFIGSWLSSFCLGIQMQAIKLKKLAYCSMEQVWEEKGEGGRVQTDDCK